MQHGAGRSCYDCSAAEVPAAAFVYLALNFLFASSRTQHMYLRKLYTALQQEQALAYCCRLIFLLWKSSRTGDCDERAALQHKSAAASAARCSLLLQFTSPLASVICSP